MNQVNAIYHIDANLNKIVKLLEPHYDLSEHVIHGCSALKGPQKGPFILLEYVHEEENHHMPTKNLRSIWFPIEDFHDSLATTAWLLKNLQTQIFSNNKNLQTDTTNYKTMEFQNQRHVWIKTKGIKTFETRYWLVKFESTRIKSFEMRLPVFINL